MERIDRLAEESSAKTAAKVLSITGANIGCGKTLLSLFAGIRLAKNGKKTLLVDFRHGTPQIPRFLGLSSTGSSLADYYLKGKKIETLIADTPVEGLKFLNIGKLPTFRRDRLFLKNNLISLLRRLDFDFVVIDLGGLADRRMMDYFILSDAHISLVPGTEVGVESLLEMCVGLYIRRFEHMAANQAGAKEAVEELKIKWVAGRDLNLAKADAVIKNRFPNLLETWERVKGGLGINVVVNFVASAEHLENVGRRLRSAFDGLAPRKVMCLPEFSVPPSAEDGPANAFVEAAYAVADDIAGAEPLGEARMSQILERGSRQSGEMEGGWIKTRNFELLAIATEDIETKRAERQDEVDGEIERLRREKTDQMIRKLDAEISKRRMDAVVAMDKELEGLRRDKLEAVEKRIQEAEAEKTAALSVEMDRKEREAEESVAKLKSMKLRETDAIVDAYYRNAKVSADLEIAQARKRRESEIDGELALQKKKKLSVMELEFASEVDKVREVLWQQLEAKHRARLDEINEAVDHYRRGRIAAAEVEATAMKADARKELEAEFARSNHATMEDIRRDVMKLAATMDVDETKNRDGLSARLGKHAAVEADKLKKIVASEVAAFKKDKELEVETSVSEDRARQLHLLSAETSKQREAMLDSIIADLRQLKEREMANITAEIARSREQRIRHAEQEILAEIHRKTAAMAGDLRDMETALDEEMRERVSAEEAKFREHMRANFNAEMAAEESSFRQRLKNSLDDERAKFTSALEKRTAAVTAEKEEELTNWVRAEKTKLAAQAGAIVNEEERVRRAEMESRLEADARAMAANLDLDRKAAEEEARQQIAAWMEHQKETSAAAAEQALKAEHERLLVETAAKVNDVRQKKLYELQHEMEIERQRRIGEVALETNKIREYSRSELEAEIRSMRESKLREFDKFALDEAKRMGERLDKRYEETMRKKEEWLEFEGKRRLIEMNTALERQAETEKSRILDQKLAALEHDIEQKRRHATSEIEETKSKLTQNLLSEIGLQRKMLVRKVTAAVKAKVARFNEDFLKRLEMTKIRRETEMEKELLVVRQRRVEQVELDLADERKRRLDEMLSGIKSEHELRRSEIIADMEKKKVELEELYEQEKKSFFEKLQKEILNSKGLTSQFLEAEVNRLQKSWRHN